MCAQPTLVLWPGGPQYSACERVPGEPRRPGKRSNQELASRYLLLSVMRTLPGAQAQCAAHVACPQGMLSGVAPGV